MKKLLIGFFALLLAFGAVAFTKEKDDRSPKTTYYWFPLNAGGTPQSVTIQPTLMSTDPYGCTASTNNCAQGFSSYTTIPGSPVTYSAAGTAGPVHKKS